MKTKYQLYRSVEYCQQEKESPAYWFLFFVLFLSCALLFDSVLHAETNGAKEYWRPSYQQLQAQERYKDCRVYQSVLQGKKEQLTQRESILLENINIAKAKYQDLEQCAAAKGIKNIRTQSGQEQASDLCAENFEAWIVEGARLGMIEEDITELKNEISTLKGAVNNGCAVAVLVKAD